MDETDILATTTISAITISPTVYSPNMTPTTVTGTLVSIEPLTLVSKTTSAPTARSQINAPIKTLTRPGGSVGILDNF